MWRSPETEPLSVDERARVRRLQIALCAVRQCDGCHAFKPVHQFSHYGSTLCYECIETPLESWWSAPYITFDELARHVGINRSNLKEWFKRGYIPHKRRHKAGNGGWIMVRAADVADICERIHQGQREGIERSRAKFTAMRRAAGRQSEAA